ncbi:hypothetical protein HY798_00120 [Candidatus Falkowbacteria bacterium]|nr:hypothetical protein [Candidatus Falkowbacteria bacterium]
MIIEFYNDPYRKEIKTKIKSVFEEDGKSCIVLEENIFYPQGGGQRGDRGVLLIGDRKIDIVDTLKDKYSDNGSLLISKEKITDDIVGQEVVCQLNWNFRCSQMRLHSALHLHHCMIEKVLGKKINNPLTADIQDGFAFNRYDNSEITEETVNLANKEFKNIVASGAEVKTCPDIEKSGWRWWECLGYKIPCGGTHIKDIKEIGEVEIKYSNKKGKSTINIQLKNN